MRHLHHLLKTFRHRRQRFKSSDLLDMFQHCAFISDPKINKRLQLGRTRWSGLLHLEIDAPLSPPLHSCWPGCRLRHPATSGGRVARHSAQSAGPPSCLARSDMGLRRVWCFRCKVGRFWAVGMGWKTAEKGPWGRDGRWLGLRPCKAAELPCQPTTEVTTTTSQQPARYSNPGENYKSDQ